MDNPTMEPSEIFYGKTPEVAESDAISATDEAITETEADETAPIEDVESDIDESETAEGEEDQATDEQEESFYVEIDGEETSFEQIKEWKSGAMMQADYTQKTQEVAEQRKDLEAQSSELANQAESIKDLAAQLEAAIGSEDEVNMEELREYDPGEYLKKKEQQDKREKLLNKAKDSLSTNKPVSDADVTIEREQLVKANPEWVDDKGNATEGYKSDMAALDKYLADNGWTQEEFSAVYQAKHIQALIKAAKYEKLQGKKAAISKKVKKAPIVKKGKAKSSIKTEHKKSATELFYSQ